MIHYGYVRVSTEMQAERESLRTQTDRLNGYFTASALNGAQVLTDAGFSAKDTNRPSLKRILQDVRAGKVASVVVTKLDRLTRSIKDLLSLLELFDAHGVRFVSLTQNLDTSTPIGRFMLQLLGIIAELERGLVSERVAEDMRVMAKKGKWLGGPVPFGYRAVDGKLEIEPEEAALVKRIFDDYLEQRSLRAVTHRLNDDGKRTRGGQPWAPTTVRRILTSDTYRGSTTFGKRRTHAQTGKVRPAEPANWIQASSAHPAIVEEKTFERVQALLPQKQGKPTRSDRVYLLSGLVRCAKCGGAMSPAHQQRGDRTWSYYRCHLRENRGATSCSSKSIRMADLDELVVSRLRELGSDRAFLRDRATALGVLKAANAAPAASTPAVAPDLRRLEEKLRRLIELYEDEAIDLPTFRERKQALDGQLEAARTQTAAAAADVRHEQSRVSEEVFEQAFFQVQKFGAEWERLDPNGRQIALRSVLKAVVVDEKQVEIQVYLDGDCGNGTSVDGRCDTVPHGCPCGWVGDPRRACRCPPAIVERYGARVSGPLRDRIDIMARVPAPSVDALTTPPTQRSGPGGSAAARAVVTGAREVQAGRGALNARLSGRQLDEAAALTRDARLALRSAAEGRLLTGRGVTRVTRVARTIADLEGRERVASEDVALAIHLRFGEAVAA